MGFLAATFLLGESGCSNILHRHHSRSGGQNYSRMLLLSFDDNGEENLRVKPRKPVFENITYKTHVAVKGDSYWRIARHYGVSLAEVLKANDASKGDILHIGQEVQVPLRNIPSNVEYYTVMRGDTLSTIARRRQCTVAELYKLNRLSDDVIKIGQQLVVPKLSLKQDIPAHPDEVNLKPQAVIGNDSYTVRRGDTLSTIAAAHGMGIKELMQINGISQPDRIREGQKLNVFVGHGQSQGQRSEVSSSPKNSSKTGGEDDLFDILYVEDLFDVSH
ncbi:MAG: LysM peptidoglycan-binding domain-containing protein [Puniceicoccales bacterium]|jgi:LysM repeat protein|nr:LysM peptidoglycan-binding domain-containing protein [Puniceicoccales bacterium]